MIELKLMKQHLLNKYLYDGAHGAPYVCLIYNVGCAVRTIPKIATLFSIRS